jgi:hypothetical protein
MALLRAAVIGGLIAATLAGCDSLGHTATDVQRQGATSEPNSSPAGPAYQAVPGDFAAIRTLLKDRANALTAGDRAAFIATVDPVSDAFVERQNTYFDNLQALPVSVVTYEVADYALIPAPVRGGDPVLRPDVSEHVFMPGTDTRPVGTGVGYTFVKRNGQWLLGAVDNSTAEFSGGAETAQPWSGGAISVEVRHHLVVVTDEAAAGTTASLADAVAGDITRVARIVHQPADTRLLVDATSVGEATRISAIGQEDAAAITYPVAATRDNEVTGLAGWRIKINPDRTQDLMLEPWLLRHEVAHYVLRRVSSCTPLWVSEGIAEYAGEWPSRFSDQSITPSTYAAVQNAPRALPSSPMWSNDPGINYLIAHAAVTFLVRQYGMDRMIDLMTAYSTCRGDDSTGDANTSGLLKQTFGVTEAEVVDGAFDLIAQLRH